MDAMVETLEQAAEQEVDTLIYSMLRLQVSSKQNTHSIRRIRTCLLPLSRKRPRAATYFCQTDARDRKLNQPSQGGGADERLWKPEMDKSGNGFAVIRFLPAPDGEEMPWAKV